MLTSLCFVPSFPPYHNSSNDPEQGEDTFILKTKGNVTNLGEPEQ